MMDIDEAKQRLAENPPQGDPTEIRFGESLVDKELRLRLEGLQRAMAAPQPAAEELLAWKVEDRAMAEKICRTRPGIPLHHAFAVLETLRVIQRMEAAAGELAAVDGESLGGAS